MEISAMEAFPVMMVSPPVRFSLKDAAMGRAAGHDLHVAHHHDYFVLLPGGSGRSRNDHHRHDDERRRCASPLFHGNLPSRVMLQRPGLWGRCPRSCLVFPCAAWPCRPSPRALPVLFNALFDFISYFGIEFLESPGTRSWRQIYRPGRPCRPSAAAPRRSSSAW